MNESLLRDGRQAPRGRTVRPFAPAPALGLLLFALLACAPGTEGDDPSSAGGAPQESEPSPELIQRAEANVSTIDDPLLREVLAPLAEQHARILADPQIHRLQILLGVPRRAGDGDWTVERHGWRVDAEYFYPASTVKMAVAVAALELIGELQGEGVAVSRTTPLRFHPQFEETETRETDESNVEGGTITVAHEVRKIFLVSDNEAYNRLFELVGRDALARSLARLGLDGAHVVHRLSEARSLDENRRFPRIDFLGPDGAVIHTIPERLEEVAQPNTQPNLEEPDIEEGGADDAFLLGEAHVAGGELVQEPFDFRFKNRFPLADLQELLVHLVMPSAAAVKESPRLSDEQLAFVRDAMAELPAQSANPVYDSDEYPDQYVKLQLPGLRRLGGGRYGIYAKTGAAYGFSIENAFVADLSRVEEGLRGAAALEALLETEPGDQGLPPGYFLTAVIYTNDNATLNDDRYEYAEAEAFFADLGESLAGRLLGAARGE